MEKCAVIEANETDYPAEATIGDQSARGPRPCEKPLEQLTEKSPTGYSPTARLDKSIRSAFKTACKHAKLFCVSSHICSTLFPSRLSDGSRPKNDSGSWRVERLME
jgi:hypothetical protein